MMSIKPRIMFAGTGSGCGKTTITCGIMKALCRAGETVVPFKCGPDYIDPMFHSHITGCPSTNLDSFFMDQTTLRWLMASRLSGQSLGIVEGVMGVFDGIGTSFDASSFDIARRTGTPVVLIVNARGMSLSAAAVITGFVEFAKRSGGEGLVRGVILNQVSKSTCAFLKPAIEAQTGLRVLGYFDRMDDVKLSSRHLGLVTAAEVEDLDERMNRLADAAASSIDLNAIREIARLAGALDAPGPSFMEMIGRCRDTVKKQPGPLRLGIARDRAFCFYYEANLWLLKSLGADLIPFSPLRDELPEQLSGLYLGGGYPELFAGELSQNMRLLEQIRQAAISGMPLIAECGGFMYLHQSIDGYAMAGVIPGNASMTKTLGPFGYVDIRTQADGLFGRKDTVFRGHEFHYSRSDAPGGSFVMSKYSGRSWAQGYGTASMYAAYPHLYFLSNVGAVIHFVEKMEEYQ